MVNFPDSLYECQPKVKFPIRLLIYNNVRYPFRTHWHNGVEIHCILEGNATLRVNGNEVYELSAGDCAVINENELHHGIDGKCSYYCLIFNRQFTPINGMSFERILRDDHVNELIKDIVESFSSGSLSDLLKAQGLSYLLFSHLTNNYLKEIHEENLYTKCSDKINRVNFAIEYIHKNYDKNISCAQIANMLHLSEGYFSNIFKQTTGETVTSYINSTRLLNAEKLLRTTNMSVTNIAFQCGFSDANYFARLCKKKRGMSPLMIRKEKRNKPTNVLVAYKTQPILYENT